MCLNNTNISWITSMRREEIEWCSYKKNFSLDEEVNNAVIRFEADCVCAIYINGEFVISGTGRYPERVNCHEVTSRLNAGANEIEIILGGHYFQTFSNSTREARGYWLNQAALELKLDLADGSKTSIYTDGSWTAEGNNELLVTRQVTDAEYNTMWKNAMLWQETQNYQPNISNEVLNVAGEKYREYALKKTPDVICCENIISTNMQLVDGKFKASNDEENYLIADLGKLIVGYVEFNYDSDCDVIVDSFFDATENLEDFEFTTSRAKTVQRLAITETLNKNKNFYRNHRRRAFRYLKLVFKGNAKNFSISSLKVRQCLFPETVKGWFNSSDEMLNNAWEMGKYTLRVNKHQEYESCPRNEMLFFAGDGEIDAMIDIYAFGDCRMLNTSLSVKHDQTANGISNTPQFNRTIWQWDYFAWRIISIYDYYRHTGDKEFLKNYYNEAVTNILWYIERMNNRNLLFQLPAFHSTCSTSLIQVDWACSVHRLGENAFLNCLLYKSLMCVAEMADEMHDNRSEEWSDLAEKVKEAINTLLWNDEKKSYVDSLGDYVAQDSNVLAIVFGIADKERALAALETVKDKLWTEHGSTMADRDLGYWVLRYGNATISPMMSTHEAVAWFMQDKADNALELIRRVWGSMIRKGATTFWEYNKNNESEKWDATCHAWSAGCTYLLSAFVAGIQPAAPDWKTITFAPRPCDIESGQCVVPSTDGLIASSWKKDENGTLIFRLAVPKNTKVVTDIPENSKVEILRY